MRPTTRTAKVFAVHSGRHVIKVFKNNVLVRTATVRA